MICKNCDNYDTVPGMKWGICRARASTTSNVISIIKGPDMACYTPQQAVKKEENNEESS